MIRAQRQLFYFVGDKPFASLEEAQKEDLVAMMPKEWRPAGGPIESITAPEHIANWMLEHAKEIVDTLTTTPRSRLRARKLHGAKRNGTRKNTPAPSTP